MIQGIMNGLQQNLKIRSKKWLGYEVYRFKHNVFSDRDIKKLKNFGVSFSLESNFEGVLDLNGFLAPVLFRGITTSSSLHIPSNIPGLSLGSGIGLSTGASIGDKVRINIPHIVDEFFGDKPRVKSVFVDSFFESSVSEVEDYHVFVDPKSLADLSHVKGSNVLRVYGPSERVFYKFLEKINVQDLSVSTWEEMNDSLVYALKLEKIMMIFLFSSLSILISQAISGGFLLLFSKLKFDFASLWILGISNTKLFRKNLYFFVLLSFLLCTLGVCFGYLMSYILEEFGGNLMPSVFVERGVPVHNSLLSFLISLFVPFFICIFFLSTALFRLQKSQDHLGTIRTIN